MIVCISDECVAPSSGVTTTTGAAKRPDDVDDPDKELAAELLPETDNIILLKKRRLQ